MLKSLIVSHIYRRLATSLDYRPLKMPCFWRSGFEGPLVPRSIKINCQRSSCEVRKLPKMEGVT